MHNPMTLRCPAHVCVTPRITMVHGGGPCMSAGNKCGFCTYMWLFHVCCCPYD